jgi:predicted nucleotidyltransferase
MISEEEIQAFSQRIVDAYHPNRIVLFGSYAYGKPHQYSDVDVLVVLPFEGSSLHKSVEILRRTNPSFSVDILARTPEQLRQRLEWNDQFLKEVVERGRVLYAASDR